jgi:hypothetical protein
MWALVASGLSDDKNYTRLCCVSRVRSRDDGRQYAVKIARERYKGFKDRDRKLEEVRKHQFLPSHTNLVKFYTRHITLFRSHAQTYRYLGRSHTWR